MNARFVTLALAGALLLAGCVSEEATSEIPAATTPAAPEKLHIVARDYALEAPERIGAGLVDVTLENQGTEIHHATFYRIPAGRTLAEFREAIIEGKGTTPSWAVAYGGPNVALPGAPASRALLRLDPGEYAIVCIIPSPDHVMHAAKGMVRGLSVVGEPNAAEPPAPTSTATLRDFGFDLDVPLKAGANVVHVKNVGQQPHEFVVFELFGNATTMEFLSKLDSGGDMPGRPVIGGTASLSPGEEVTTFLELTPGRYTIVCFDATGTEDYTPHFLHGMIQEFVLEA